MNPLHLIWICPLCCSIGVFGLAILIGGSDGK